MIEIRQSQLDAFGYQGPFFPSLPFQDKVKLAANICRLMGRIQAAELLERNNPMAVSSIRYVNDR